MKTLYRVFSVMRDENGNIIHKSPCSSTYDKRNLPGMLAAARGLFELIVEETQVNID